MRRKHQLMLTTAAITALLCSCASKFDRPPDLDYIIGVGYHYCEKCGSLQGGIYGKGPTRRFAGTDKENCIHEWQEIKRERFKQLGTELHDCDWSQESHFFRYENPPPGPQLEQMHDLPLMTPEDSIEMEQP